MQTAIQIRRRDQENMYKSEPPGPLSLRLVQTARIPAENPAPGPLHTILRDSDGSVYYSDEINHCVASLDRAGKTRWRRSGQGRKPGEFWYPRGIDPGWVTANGCASRCVAVCDSWNHRIQFFDPEGGLIGQWKAAGNIPFNEVVDIRFISADPLSGGADACWLVLDRGNHRICGLDLTGRQIFQIGRQFAQNLEMRWPVPAGNPDEAAGYFARIGQARAFDPLFMPLRIFGSTPEALFIWEPKSQRLKQISFGNLLPIWIQPPHGGEWIGADAEGLLAFSPASSCVSSWDTKTGAWRSVPVEGTPIPSSRSSRRFWIQRENELRCFECEQAARNSASGRTEAGAWALERLVNEFEIRLGDAATPQGIETLGGWTDRLRATGQKAMKLEAVDASESNSAAMIREDLVRRKQELPAAVAATKEFEHSHFLALLKLQLLLLTHPEIGMHAQFGRAAACLHASVRPMSRIFEQILRIRETCCPLAAEKNGRSELPQPAGSRAILLEEVADTAHAASIELVKWSWFVSATDRLTNAADSAAHGPAFAQLSQKPWLRIAWPSPDPAHSPSEAMVQAQAKTHETAEALRKPLSSRPCPVCGGNAPFALAIREHPYYRCDACRAVFTSRIDESIMTTENQDAQGRHDPIQDETRLLRLKAATARKIIDVLDYGCGNGEYARNLAGKIQCLSVDQHTPLQLKDIGDSAVDGINAVEVIEHLYNPVQVFSEFYRVLRPDGVLYVESSFARDQDLASWEYLDPAIGHCLVHSEQSLLFMANKLNFKLKKYNDNVFLFRKPADAGGMDKEQLSSAEKAGQ